MELVLLKGFPASFHPEEHSQDRVTDGHICPEAARSGLNPQPHTHNPLHSFSLLQSCLLYFCNTPWVCMVTFPPPVLPFLSLQEESGRSPTSCSDHSVSHRYVIPQGITTSAFTRAEIPRKTVSRPRYHPDSRKSTEKTPQAAGEIRGVWQPSTCSDTQPGPHRHKFSGKNERA